MDDVYITSLHIGKVRHLEGVHIELSEKERKHLILTGKNGSGKTSLLEAIRDDVASTQKELYTLDIAQLSRSTLTSIEICYSTMYKYLPHSSDVIFAYIPAERSKLEPPKSIEPVNIQGKNIITRNASREFLKYILSLDYRRYGAISDKNKELEENLEKWFDNFIKALRNIYQCAELELQRDTKNYAFLIKMPDREPFALNEMAAGYAAFLDIFVEILMRFEGDDAVVNYEKPAIVLIDEVETHLHVELQKRALPFLTQMFPNVQFVVSTHSPFVMSSLENAVVYDLEKKEYLENFNLT